MSGMCTDENFHPSSFIVHHYQNGISEGQTAVFAYPSAFSDCKSSVIYCEIKGFTSKNFEMRGGECRHTKDYFTNQR